MPGNYCTLNVRGGTRRQPSTQRPARSSGWGRCTPTTRLQGNGTRMTHFDRRSHTPTVFLVSLRLTWDFVRAEMRYICSKAIPCQENGSGRFEGLQIICVSQRCVASSLPHEYLLQTYQVGLWHAAKANQVISPSNTLRVSLQLSICPGC